MEFKKYVHLERFNTREVKDINIGTVHVFSKLDGTNASVWLDSSTGALCAGSRNRMLTADADNAGFYKWALQQQPLHAYLHAHPTHRLYGEWLVPHTIRHYEDDAWRNLYVFDVWCDQRSAFLPYDEYASRIERAGIAHVPRLAVLYNPTESELAAYKARATFLTQENKHPGEGIVIKNYGFRNKFGRQTWAKMLNPLTQNKNASSGKPVDDAQMEQLCVQKCVDNNLIAKTLWKTATSLCLPQDAADDTPAQSTARRSLLPRTLNEIFYDLVTEELYEFVKAQKFPTIDFRRLKKLCTDHARAHLLAHYADAVVVCKRTVSIK